MLGPAAPSCRKQLTRAGAAATRHAQHLQPLHVHLLLSQHCAAQRDGGGATQCAHNQVDDSKPMRPGRARAGAGMALQHCTRPPPAPAASKPAASTAATSCSRVHSPSPYCTSACSKVRLTEAATAPGTCSRAASTAAAQGGAGCRRAASGWRVANEERGRNSRAEQTRQRSRQAGLRVAATKRRWRLRSGRAGSAHGASPPAHEEQAMPPTASFTTLVSAAGRACAAACVTIARHAHRPTSGNQQHAHGVCSGRAPADMRRRRRAPAPAVANPTPPAAAPANPAKQPERSGRRTCAAEQLGGEAGGVYGGEHGVQRGLPGVQQDVSLLPQQEHARFAHAAHRPARQARGAGAGAGRAARS